MVGMAIKLIKAKLTGSLLMHFQAVSNCLIDCLCCRWALQLSARKLEEKYPDVYRKFLDCFHVVRMRNKCWARRSSDLVIEQTLMRSVKSAGGLTRGSGMTEDMQNLWTLSTPVTSEYNIAMQDFTNLTYTTSMQHKYSTGARIKRD